MIKIAICGGSGYTGAELLRILSGHPEVEITAVTSEKSAGKKVTDLFPHLHKYARLVYEPLNKEDVLKKADLFFMALPHGASQEAVDYFFKKGKKVIDLSADYRISDSAVYEEWYKAQHNYTDTLNKAVYGLPELHREEIKKANLIANPGCYPTSAILGLYPAIKEGVIDIESIVVDSKSGASGAGRKADVGFSYCEVNEGFKAYGIGVHRHTPEIEQELSGIAGKKIAINFTPHLVPMDRGIISTMYGKMIKKADTEDILAGYKESYGAEPFVNVLAEGIFPNAKNVRGSNYCEIGLKVNKRTNTLIVVSAIDNLVKGASGQAVQNMNIMMGIKETTALESLAVFP
ncbi:MAG TPA: N-acetyl-gamma-glutamyl-phosphate reductase [Nitrospiraceae bacterium]|nr:MAG: N-acetyl-gamma-glutamyl-phosphate reductase [Nitrospirae bacterium GWA2_46_11]OGW23531.1 MAG: N-acetyl-gamma-glutamyl-phosphate reductase [Nitrospirae bacterium GWB2_47_37]HAK87503.1 N-acetyl-gamma-glutamyl-phosphate reductase [Nitrospiraceae bacterium]HCZ11751.1 N-acetyl-gamma-glutamyl-phosphate reductase [Nitrospiraceae bacterium]